MLQFTHLVKDPVGIHAGPAGRISRKAKEFPGTVITIDKQGTSVQANKLMLLMGLGVKGGDTITVTIEGGEEEKAAAAMKEFLEKELCSCKANSAGLFAFFGYRAAWGRSIGQGSCGGCRCARSARSIRNCCR